jgi:hypothetical protein
MEREDNGFVEVDERESDPRERGIDVDGEIDTDTGLEDVFNNLSRAE